MLCNDFLKSRSNVNSFCGFTYTYVNPVYMFICLYRYRYRCARFHITSQKNSQVKSQESIKNSSYKIASKVSSTNSCKVIPQHISAVSSTETTTYRLKSSTGNTPLITKSSQTTITHITKNIRIPKKNNRKKSQFSQFLKACKILLTLVKSFTNISKILLTLVNFTNVSKILRKITLVKQSILRKIQGE